METHSLPDYRKLYEDLQTELADLQGRHEQVVDAYLGLEAKHDAQHAILLQLQHELEQTRRMIRQH